MQLVQETQGLQAQAGYASWKDLLEATRRDLEDFESLGKTTNTRPENPPPLRGSPTTMGSLMQGPKDGISFAIRIDLGAALVKVKGSDHINIKGIIFLM